MQGLTREALVRDLKLDADQFGEAVSQRLLGQSCHFPELFDSLDVLKARLKNLTEVRSIFLSQCVLV